MATAQKVKLSSEMQYLNERLRDGRAVLHSGFSMKRLGNPDPAFQPRVVHLDMDHVKTLDDIYQARGALDPVVLVHVADKDLYILVDGFHRHEVYKRAGETALPAYVIEGTVNDALEYAAMANQHAILRRQPEDIKKQIYMLLSTQKWSERSDTIIAKHVGAQPRAVAKFRIMFCDEQRIPLPTHYLAEDGRRIARKNGKKAGLPAIWKDGQGRYISQIRGKTITLGRSLPEATERMEAKVSRVESRREMLHPKRFFHQWLPARDVVFDHAALPVPTFPGLGYSGYGHGRVVITARLDESGAIYTAIGRLYALREILDRPGDRLVMVCVCYPDDGPEALVEVARRLGVELLTPEELVASIKADGGPDAIDGYPPHVPNAETTEALRDADNGEGLVSYGSPEGMFKALDIEDEHESDAGEEATQFEADLDYLAEKNADLYRRLADADATDEEVAQS